VNAIFIDTGGWVACADGSDPAYEASRAARDSALASGRLLVTTDFVVDETLTLIRSRLGLRAADVWWRRIDGASRVRWERIDAERFEKARQLFFQHADKDYSFTDCTSFVVMKALRLTHALTTDRHFAQMGFRLLPGSRR
jgi:uncharacterized protein